MASLERIIIEREQQISDLKNKKWGLYTGVITNVNDPENLGRVKIRVKGILDEDFETDWASVIYMATGQDAGQIFQIEEGDPVFVAFLNGDVDNPVWIGTRYTEKHKPPAEIKKGKKKRQRHIIKTKKGHILVMSDEKKEKYIQIKTEKGHLIKVDDKENEIIIKSKNGNIIHIDDVLQKIKIKSNMTIDVETALSVNIRGTAEVNITGARVYITAATSVNKLTPILFVSGKIIHG